MIGVWELGGILGVIIIFYLAQIIWINRRAIYYGLKMPGNMTYAANLAYHYNFGTKKGLMESWFNEIQKAPITKMWMLDRLVVTLTRPEDIEKIFTVALEKEPGYTKFFGIVLTNGLLTAPAHIWRRHRKAINYAFNQKIIDSYCEIFAKHARNLVVAMEKHANTGYVELFPVISKSHLNMTCETAMGTEVKDLNDQSNYMEWIRRAEYLMGSRIFNPFLYPDFIWKMSGIGKQIDTIVEDTFNFIGKIIHVRRQNTQNNEEDFSVGPLTKKKIFLDHLLQVTDKDGWTDQELKDEVQTVVIAGSETTATTECYALVFIAMHPHVQQLLHQEIDHILGDDPHREIRLEDINRMEYLDRVIKEAMRLCPLAFAPARYMVKDVILGETLIPKGASVAGAVLYVHRDPEIWPEPLKFDPDRFLPEEVEKRHRYAYLPFSGGPRSCIGWKHAMLSMKTVIASILRTYKLVDSEIKTVEDFSFNFDIILSSEKGYRVAYERRT